MAYKWPTDGPMALPKHSIPWEQELANRKAKGATTVPNWTGGAPIPIGSGQATPQPPDPNLALQTATGTRNVALARGEGAYQQGNLNFDYGYNTDGSVNTSNPYSRAALLMLNYQHQQNATTNQMAAAGQLYSGAYANQQGIDQGNYAQADAANRLGYQRSTHGVQAGVLGTMATNALGVGDEAFQALLKAVYPGG